MRLNRERHRAGRKRGEQQPAPALSRASEASSYSLGAAAVLRERAREIELLAWRPEARVVLFCRASEALGW